MSLPCGIGFDVFPSLQLHRKGDTRFQLFRESEGVRSPVFLIVPSSGTTLLDQVLSSHSRITVLEEKRNLAGAIRQFPATEEG
jgi:hypothetical protein